MSLRKARGFTLLELVVVLAIMALAATIALPNLGSLASLRGAGAARRVVSILNDARSRAVNTAAPVEVSYDFESASFTEKAAGGREIHRFDLPGGIRVTGFESGGVLAEEGLAAVTFYPLGDSSGAVISLREEGGRVWKIEVGAIFATPAMSRSHEGG